MKSYGIFILALAMAGGASASAPQGYYSKCEGLSGQELLEALYEVVGPHDNVGYSGLWSVYATSDVRPEDGSVEDMYSTKHWVYSVEQCGNYSAMGDCYNREHSMPKSWFSEQEPMRSDAHHIFPTDGWVNNKRLNYPYGECAGGTTWSNGSMKALGRLGASTFPGYQGQVFEPDDMYKGDFARAYFYMAACYNPLIDDWKSDMLAGNSYPAFTDWAVNLLLKWHRNDAVSDKEERRNDAVEAWQHNRNPFVDHPEFAEHIWGDKKSVAWHETDYSDAGVVSPTEGTVIDLGLVGRNVSRSTTVAVRALGITSPLSVAVEGEGWSCTTSTISADLAIKGTDITITYTGATAGVKNGTLKITSPEVSSQYSLTAEVAAGIPALTPQLITAESFVASWINIHDAAAEYTLTVTAKADGEAVAGYPVKVKAADESHTVEGLNPRSTYIYTLSYGNETSNTVEVKTTELLPEITLDCEPVVALSAFAGESSATVEINVDAENVGNGFTVAVNEPFELSNDLVYWATELELEEDDSHFYLRVTAATPGMYNTPISLMCESYLNDNYAASAVVKSRDWVETFELPTDWTGYGSGKYNGTAGTWEVKDGNVYDDTFFNGSNVLRLGKTSTSSVALAEPKEGGLGSVAFDAATWSLKSDKAAVVEVEYTLDGETWMSIATATVDSEESTHYSYPIDVEGDVRVRLRQTSGARWLLDNLALTNSASYDAIETVGADRTWDAMLRDGRLTVLTYGGNALDMRVYSVDGILRHASKVDGQLSLSLPAGLYIVVSGDEAKRVLVK